MLKFESFLLGQPCCPEETATDRYYYGLTVRMIEAAHGVAGALASIHESVVERAALCVIGYYQDMIADAGLWHGFTDECRRLYGTPVPFHDKKPRVFKASEALGLQKPKGLKI